MLDSELDEGVGILALSMCQFSQSASNIRDSSSALDIDEQNEWLALWRFFSSEPYRLTWSAASCSAVLMESMLNIPHVIDNDGYELENWLYPHISSTLINALESLLAYEAFYDYDSTGLVDEYLRNLSLPLLSFCSAASKYHEIFEGELAIYTSQRSWISVEVLEVKSDFTDLHLKRDSIALNIPDLMAGQYCLVSYRYPIYEQRVSSVLGSGAIQTLPGPYLNGTESLANGYFIIDIKASLRNDVAANLTNSVIVTCRENDFSSHPILCVNASEFMVQCTGEETVVRIECPFHSLSDVNCSASSVSNNTSGDINECVAINTTQLSVSCTCISTQSASTSFVKVNFKKLLAAVSGDLLQVLAFQRFNINRIKTHCKDLLLLFVVILFLSVSLFYVDFLNAQQVQESLKKRTRGRPLKKLLQNDDEEISFLKKFRDDDMFPEALLDNSFVQMFIDEARKSHRWVSVCFHYDVDFPRYWRFLLLASMINCVIFFHSVIISGMEVKRQHCEGYSHEMDCLREESMFSSDVSMCYWEMTSQTCRFREARRDANLLLIMAAISGLLCLPFSILMEVIVIQLLCKPLRKSHAIAPLDDEEIEETWSPNDIRDLKNPKKRGQQLALSNETRRSVTFEVKQLVLDLSLFRSALSTEDAARFDAHWGFCEHDLATFLEQVKDESCVYPQSDASYSNSDEVAVTKKSSISRCFSNLFGSTSQASTVSLPWVHSAVERHS